MAVRVSKAAALLIRAATEYPGDVEVVDLNPWICDVVRQNPKRPAHCKLLLPDQVAMSLNGEKDKRGHLLAMWVPIEVLQDLQRQEAGILTPAEAAAGGGPLIVTP